jgi:hypothetical protein
LIELLPPRHDLHFVQRRPAFDLLALYLRRDERFAFATGDARDADVTVDPARTRSLAATRTGSTAFACSR